MLLLCTMFVVALAWIANAINDTLMQAQAIESDVTAEFASGQRAMEAGRTLLAEANAEANADKIRQAEAAFSAARQRFIQARRLIDSNPVIQRWESIPGAASYVKPRRDAVDRLADASTAISDAANAIAAIDARLIAHDPSIPAPAALEQVLSNSGPYIGAIEGRLLLARVQPASSITQAAVIG